MCTDPIFPEKPVYGSNNWYYAYGHSSQDEILADTDYLISLTEGLENRPFMVIDDCWQEHRTDEYIGGPWKKCNERFRDMKGLAAAIKEKGAKPGIWMRLLLNIDSEIPDSWRLYNQCLDPSHPDALEYIKADVDRICSWGYELIKHDFTTFDLFNRWGFQMHPYMTKDGWHFYDRSLTSAEVVIRLYEAILEASKPYGTLIIGCNTIGHLGAGLMHMHRIGDDTSGLMWERTLRMGVNTLAFRMPQHKTFFDIDADCVGVTGAIDWEKNRQWNHLLSRSGTVYFASIKPGILDEEQIREMKSSMEAASRQQDFLCVPLDWMESVYPEIWSISDEASGVQDEVEYNWYEDTGMTTVKPDDIHWLYNDRKLF
jgi:alpha-galactosidase